MSVGGWIIESRPLENGLVLLWVVDNHGTETAVKVKPGLVMPGLGTEIWWQSGWVYFDRDRRKLEKVGYSFDPAELGE